MKTLPDGTQSSFDQDMHPDSLVPQQPTTLSEAINFLGNPEYFDSLFESLKKFAEAQISGRRWFGGNKPEAEHIAADAIYAIAVDSVRTWDPAKCSFNTMCCLVISSKIKNEFVDSMKFPSIPADETFEAEVHAGSSATIQLRDDDPARALTSAEDWDQFMKLLPVEDTEANLLLLKIVDEMAFSHPLRDEPKPGNRPRKPRWSNLELAKRLSVSVDAIENAKKRLRPILHKWQFELFVKTLPDDGRPWQAFVNAVMDSSPSSSWRDTFAQSWSLDVAQVSAMGVELGRRLKTFRKGTWRNVDLLANQAHRIEQNNIQE